MKELEMAAKTTAELIAFVEWVDAKYQSAPAYVKHLNFRTWRTRKADIQAEIKKRGEL